MGVYVNAAAADRDARDFLDRLPDRLPGHPLPSRCDSGPAGTVGLMWQRRHGHAMVAFLGDGNMTLVGVGGGKPMAECAVIKDGIGVDRIFAALEEFLDGGQDLRSCVDRA